MTPIGTSRRNLTVVAAVLVAVALAVAVVSLAGSGGDKVPDAASQSQGSGQAGTSSPSRVVRATGPGSCAFLSVDDLRQATGAPQVELRQTLGPNGNPGCEWALGDDRRILQLEFHAGRAPATLPQGEDVPGPWRTARWVASTRTLHIDANGQVMFLRATDSDPGRAKAVSTAVGALVAERN